MPSQPTILPLSLIKDTRTRTRRFDPDEDLDHTPQKSWFGGGGGGGGDRHGRGSVLPLYKSKRRRSRGAANSSWSLYYAPRRRSKRLVVLWLTAFLIAGLVTWWMMSTWREENGRSVAVGEIPGEKESG